MLSVLYVFYWVLLKKLLWFFSYLCVLLVFVEEILLCVSVIHVFYCVLLKQLLCFSVLYVSDCFC